MIYGPSIPHVSQAAQWAQQVSTEKTGSQTEPTIVHETHADLERLIATCGRCGVAKTIPPARPCRRRRASVGQ